MLYRSFLALALLLLTNTPAFAAKLMFGTSESIRFVANTSLRGPSGARLFLGRKVTTKSFLLPYTVKDDGFVLGISGESSRYIALPTGAELERLQVEGFLPKPLPSWKVDWLDWLFGHLLWVLVVGVGGWYLRKHLILRRKV
jgi:hypothetical protein